MDAQHKRQKRWPRRLAIGLAVTGTVLATTYWVLGREATLQALVRKVADASGGAIVITGVSGSLYSHMHMGHVEFRSPEQRISADNIDIDWSPWQVLSSGIAVSKLTVAALRIDTLKQGKPAIMPASLAAPFGVAIRDARIASLTLANAAAPGQATRIGDVRFRLDGDAHKWQLRDASALTPWGALSAEGSIATRQPFKLEAAARLAQDKGSASLQVRAAGDLNNTVLTASGEAGKASGTARAALMPFEAIPLRALDIDASGIAPDTFAPGLPRADLGASLSLRIDGQRKVSGKFGIANTGAAGTLDQQRLPLRSLGSTLGGSLDALRMNDVLLDFGAAGKFAGRGSITRADAAVGSASFKLRTERFDLRHIHGSIGPTRIAGDIELETAKQVQTLRVQLADSGLKLDALATVAANAFTLKEARIAAGSGTLAVTGSARLDGTRAFKAKAIASHFNPAALGKYPAADLNADLDASGALAPAWNVAAAFVLRPSRLLDQPLAGSGRFDANARHLSGVAVQLALGQNTAQANGSFGQPGEKLEWKLDAKQLSALPGKLHGAVAASGAATGTMDAPRTSFTVEARGLGTVATPRTPNNSIVQASGQAWLANKAAAVKLAGTVQKLNPANFGSPLAGSVHASFDGAGAAGAAWNANVNVLQTSSLSSAPFWGHARLQADAKHLASADVDLHVGPNIAAVRGAFGEAGDQLEWRIDAPQLAALGSDFAGVLRGTGTLGGTAEMPSLGATLEGQNLKLLGAHQLKALRASASLGAGRGTDDRLVSDIEITGYANRENRIASARLRTSGTRGEHALHAAARGEAFDFAGDVAGAWNGDAWTGTVKALQNKGRYGFTLQAPVPLRVATAPGAGALGLARPEEIALSNATFKLPDGSISVQSLEKTGGRWRSAGSAAGVPLNYLAQASEGMQDNVRGDLAIGAQWELDLQTAASTGGAPALSGMLHVFREKGDLIVGAEMPVVLGLRTLDVRADVTGGALRTQLAVDGTRAGQARIDATMQLLDGRLANDSPLKLTASADMGSIAWLAPLSGMSALELDGALKLALDGAGTVGNPTLNGSISGDKLALRWAEQGVKLKNGALRAQLAGDQLLLQRLAFEGVQGSATADGSVRFAGGETSMQLKLVAEKLEVLSRPDRTVVITGQSTLVRDAKKFTLDGKFRAERAVVELAPQDRPTISNDVIILGKTGIASAPRKETGMPLTVDVEADLGDNFRLRGMGIDAELTGEVRIRASGGRAPRVNGSIRVASGTYRAYGQNLAIERGVLTFSGPYDNPALNILALRKRPDGEQLTETNVEAGVQVRGTAQAPSAKLVSTPSVPNSEKLAWLVLGHGLEGSSGNEAGVLGAAASALLGGSGGGLQSRLSSALGVDELGLSQAKGLESTVVTVGKRISARAYLSFEQGATSASSLVKLRYKLNPRVTLQFQTGTNTALDVLYSWAFD